MTRTIPDSIKNRCNDFVLTFISTNDFKSNVVLVEKECWGSGLKSKTNEDTSWSYQVYYEYRFPEEPKEEYSFYITVVDGKITNNSNPFPPCLNTEKEIKIIKLEEAKSILFRHNKNYEINWSKVSYRLVRSDCFAWVFSYKSDPPKGKNIPSSSLYNTVKIDAIHGKVIPQTGVNN